MLHHRHRPGLRQRPLPDDADGPVRSEVAHGARVRAPRLHQLRGRLRGRDGHRPPARLHAAAREPRHPDHGVGRDRADDGARRRHRARRDHDHLGQVGDATDRKTAKGVIDAGHVAAIRFTINGVYKGETRHQLEHVNRIGPTPRPTGRPARPTTSTASTSRARRRSPRRRRSGSPTAAAATPPSRAAWPPGCARSTRCPRSTTCRRAGSPPLDLPLIPGVGTIR